MISSCVLGSVMKKILMIVCSLLGLTLMALALSEIYLRVTSVKYENPAGKSWNFGTNTPVRFREKLIERDPHSTPEALAQKENYFYPPFRVILQDPAFPDTEKNALIASERPKPGVYKYKNVTLPPEQQAASEHVVTINSFGFRDPERKLAKEKNLIRIVVYGESAALGLELNDDETYPRILEKLLNEREGGKFHFEVWNGALPRATVSMGYARMKAESPSLKPDLVIWDFGFVENSMANRTYIHNFGTPEHEASAAKIMIKNICDTKYIDRLYLCKKIRSHLGAVSVTTIVNTMAFHNRNMVEYSVAHQFPTLMVSHGFTPSLESGFFAALADNATGTFYVSTKEPLANAIPSPEEVAQFWSKPNWTSELEMSEEKLKKYPDLAFYAAPYRYSAPAMRIFADVIEKKIHELIENGYLKPGVSFPEEKK